MKYLLGYLEGISDAPSIADPDFQQLLVDVQASKPQKSSDAFYDSLEKVVNELRSTPEAAAFLKPVSKRDAPDYFQYITRPMDLSTVLRNVKAHKYKNKGEFGNDVDQIWKNCLTYNTTANHPLRAVATFLRQKTNHLLEFVADRDDAANNPLLSLLSSAGASAAVQRAASQQPGGGGPSGTADDEDAAGESDDAMGEEDDGTAVRKSEDKDPNGRATPDVNASRDGRATSAGSTLGDRRVNGRAANGTAKSPPPFRPNLQANLEAPALIRTPYTMAHLQPVSLNEPGPSFSDKGKARDILYGNAPPPWYPVSVTTDDEDAKLEGYWWGMTSKDDAYVSGLPAVPSMMEGPSQKRRRVASRRQHRSVSPQPNGKSHFLASVPPPPSLVPSKPVSLERVVQRGLDKMVDARHTMNIIQDWQRYYEGDGMGPPPPVLEPPDVERARLAEERSQGKRKRREIRAEAAERSRSGGEVGAAEAAVALKRVTASLLAHAGFEGANEIPLDLMTRVAGDYLRNLGRTFRLLMDGFAHQMNSEEIVLHALHENGEMELQDLESHIKDDIERETAKVTDMQRKVRQAYKELTTGPVIEDDMLFAQDGEMLQHGDFAEDLGEDFLGLRELGIDKEFGLSTLSVPKALFFGRRNRANAAAAGNKEEQPDFPPPPPFIALTPATFKAITPALMHAFYAQRLEGGTGVDKDDVFDTVHASIGPLGQIVQKPPPGAVAKKSGGKKEANGDGGEKKEKKPAKKTGQPGVGKGNWIRPSKEERERRAAEKKAELERRQREEAASAGTSAPPGEAEEDAEGDEE